ncbi:hypothetical protein WMF45_34655 [Sorangium sp. So ce448]|uniref:hypothetical protein n=1 Tax=Sorangium sp. So ce448 TaxID=3133314 RepID=UPI003F60091A
MRKTKHPPRVKVHNDPNDGKVQLSNHAQGPQPAVRLELNGTAAAFVAGVVSTLVCLLMSFLAVLLSGGG